MQALDCPPRIRFNGRNLHAVLIHRGGITPSEGRDLLQDSLRIDPAAAADGYFLTTDPPRPAGHKQPIPDGRLNWALLRTHLASEHPDHPLATRLRHYRRTAQSWLRAEYLFRSSWEFRDELLRIRAMAAGDPFEAAQTFQRIQAEAALVGGWGRLVDGRLHITPLQTILPDTANRKSQLVT